MLSSEAVENRLGPVGNQNLIFFFFMHFLSSDTTIQVEAIFTEALLPGLDTRLLHTQHLTGTRDPSKDLTTTRETLVVDCVIVALNAEIKFSTPKGFEPRSRQCRRKVYDEQSGCIL